MHHTQKILAAIT